MAHRLLHPEQALLLVVDIQERFVPVIHEVDHLIERTKILIEAANRLEMPVLVSEQYPKGLGRTIEPLREVLPDTAVVLEKTAFGCLEDPGIGSKIEAMGKGQGRHQVLVCGIEAHVCVNQTVHQLLGAGYQPHLIEDAISARDPWHLQIGLNKMRQSGAIHSCVEMALFELMKNSLHPHFKPLQALIK